MPTQCNPNRFAFAPAEGRPVVASFDGGAITSDAGALLLGATDRVLGLTRRLASHPAVRADPRQLHLPAQAARLHNGRQYGRPRDRGSCRWLRQSVQPPRCLSGVP